ncbi:MAG: hypothetical protein DCC55_25170 [Chloroflexi bacterium]|nr:MAG: hypothetical protein DCC55_25170 [Chloroflexota bacterium]
MNRNDTRSAFDQLIAFLDQLEQQRISYELAYHREGAIMVTVALPGQQWEVEFLADDSVEVEKFISDGDIGDESALVELFAVHSATSPMVTEPFVMVSHS